MGTGGHQVFHPELVDLFRMVLYKNGCINYINVVFMCRFTWEQGGLTLPWRSLWGLGSGWPDWSVFRLSLEWVAGLECLQALSCSPRF